MQYGYKESVPDLSDLIDHVSRRAERKGPVTENFEETLHCNPQFFGFGVQKLGEDLLTAVEGKASELGNV